MEKSWSKIFMRTCSKARSRRRRQGTSLIEVMVGILLLTVLFIAVTTSLSYPRSMALSRTHQQAAIHAANEILEEALSKGYASSSLDFGTESLSNLVDRYTLNNDAISGSRTVSMWDSRVPPTKLILVSVNYPGGDTPVVLQTILTP